MKTLLQLLLFAAIASAHTLQITGVSVRIEGNSTTVQVVAHLPILGGADPAIELPRRLQLSLGGTLFRATTSSLTRDAENDTVTWTGREDRTAGSVTMLAPIFPDHAEDSTLVLVYRDGEVVDKTMLNPSHPSAIVGENTVAVIRRFIEMGIFHILTGADHIFFLLGLILAGGTVRRLLGIVTAFTVAHSITLTLTVLGIASLSPRLVEPIIALSIVVVGLENLFRRSRDNAELRVWLAFGFGFFHGFGFAGSLAEVGLNRQALGWSLASFNVGVEIGQACILAIVLPLLALIRRKSESAANLVTKFASIVIAIAGAVWFVARVWE